MIGLFFSFDHNHFTRPSEYTDYLMSFLARPSYFKINNKPIVSTFNGESVTNDEWTTFKAAVGDILLIPGFSAATPSPDFFTTRSALDGVFNWNSWPDSSAGKIEVSDTEDAAYLAAAHSQNKLFIMGVSPLQFKHIDPSQNNWYRRGEGNLEVRLEQALKLQPDMIELQTWNDAGESHYMGNWWEDPIQGTPILDYVREYDHRGYWNILGPFIQAWKRGDTTTSGMVPSEKDVQGTFWHHTLAVNADCGSDGFGKPRDFENAEDVVSGIVLVATGKTGFVAIIHNGDQELGTISLVEGFNKFKVEGLSDGQVSVKILDGSGATAVEASGPLEVSSSATLCNYNFQVLGF
ncbi:hypothetical protein SLS60_009227 [Paraconiothyrium brasiliense]|uniref:Glycoside hydrolase family 71 protein n=1 Tax=Paraconiothyrium brasiliense TaxID=300254 RepID=A0ABR3QXG9_9PLEO